MSSYRLKTPEEAAWLKANCESMCNEDCIDAFEREFGWRLTDSGLRTWMYRNGLHVKKSRKINLFTREQRAWLRDNKEWFTSGNHAYEMFAEAFPGTNKKVEDVRSWLNGHGKTFGHQSWFEKGMDPPNSLPIGTERTWHDTVYVKMFNPEPGREGKKSHEGWVVKARVVWEQANGRPVPEGHMLRYADGDRSNLDPSNLVPVPKELNGVMASMGLRYHDRESLETAIEIARLTRQAKRMCEDAGVSWEKVKKEATNG